MVRLALITIGAGVALLFGAAVHAQQQPSSPPPPPPAYGAPISLEQAKAAIAGATAESKKITGIMFLPLSTAAEISLRSRNRISLAIPLYQ
jgi:hypothetical protein